MSIGFCLIGELNDAVSVPAILFARLENWIIQNCKELEPFCRRDLTEEKSFLYCTFHPAAEEVEISLADSRRITIS
jgi:hypothetical protein